MTAATFSSSRGFKDNRFARLSLEKLEARDCPTQITQLSAAIPYQHHVEISGLVTDCPAAGMEVRITGAASGTAYTNSDGTFSFATDDAALGTIYAVVMDEEIAITDIADAQITSNAPTVLFDYIANDTGNFWTIHGHVSDEWAQGLTVRIGGLLGTSNFPPPPPGGGPGRLFDATDTSATSIEYLTATVDANGDFDLYVYLDPSISQSAVATGEVTDWWGLQSEMAFCSLM